MTRALPDRGRSFGCRSIERVTGHVELTTVQEAKDVQESGRCADGGGAG